MDYVNHIPQPDENGVRLFCGPEEIADVFDVAMIRERPAFKNIPEPGRGVLLVDIGGGNKHLFGYERLDWPTWDAESMPMPYEDGSVDALFSAHAFDHFTAHGVVRVLAEGQRVLKPGGTFTIVVPHFMSTLAMECLEHHTRFGIKTWRNILSNPAYIPHLQPGGIEWELSVGFNMIMGVEERNLVLVTQLVKNGA
jgi:SAM-dependent methyltransferase